MSAIALAPTAAPSPLHDLHAAMVDGVVSGHGLECVCELAAAELGATVAIVIPRLHVAAVAGAARLDDLRRYVSARVAGRPARIPRGLAGEREIRSGGELLGEVLLLGPADAEQAGEVVHLAAMAALTALALDGSERGGERLVEDLLVRDALPARQAVVRAERVGVDLSRGAIALSADLRAAHPRRARALLEESYPGALAAVAGTRLHALLPLGDDAARLAERGARRLESLALVGLSPPQPEPGRLHHALREADLVLELVRAGRIGAPRQALEGTWRLLLRLASERPEELEAFHGGGLDALEGHDRAHGADLLGTLRAYLEHGCNMNATAAAIHAHRHTIAYRLDRVRELCGLDAADTRDRERLAVGLKVRDLLSVKP